jgi:AraC-like DNA-binding protein
MDLIWLTDDVVVAGPDQSAFIAPQRPGTTITGLRFHPGTAPTLLGVPARVLRGQRVPLRELNPALADRATRLVTDGASPDDALLGTVVAARESVAGTPPFGGAGAHLVTRLLAAGASVASTAEALGWTTRSLHRHANDAFGYGPATLRRVLRFHSALALARGDVPAAEAAARAGYADQAHLAREVRALAGVPLTQLLAESRGANNSTGLPSGSASTA